MWLVSELAASEHCELALLTALEYVYNIEVFGVSTLKKNNRKHNLISCWCYKVYIFENV